MKKKMVTIFNRYSGGGEDVERPGSEKGEIFHVFGYVFCSNSKERISKKKKHNVKMSSVFPPRDGEKFRL